VSGALYLLPDEEDFVQPTFKADRGRLHLETRYAYEDRESVSFFAGANFELGNDVTLALTPMIGGLAGRTDGIIPAFEANLTVGPFEAYGEAEYVFDLGDGSSSYFYMWSELSLWPTEWLRAGVVTFLPLQPGQRRSLRRGVPRRVLLRRGRSSRCYTAPVPMNCVICQKDDKESTLHKCPICFKLVCSDCARREYGRTFCSKLCADQFFFGDDDE
jgi:hypothetical protein